MNIDWSYREISPLEGDIKTTEPDEEGYRTRFQFTRGQWLFHSKFLDWRWTSLREEIIQWPTEYKVAPDEVDWSKRDLYNESGDNITQIYKTMDEAFGGLSSRAKIYKRMPDGSLCWYYYEHSEEYNGHLK